MYKVLFRRPGWALTIHVSECESESERGRERERECSSAANNIVIALALGSEKFWVECLFSTKADQVESTT
jgi:hypothetical protein